LKTSPNVAGEKAKEKSCSEIIQGTNHTANLDQLLELIHHSLKKAVYADNCFVTLYDESTGYFIFPFFADKYDSRHNL